MKKEFMYSCIKKIWKLYVLLSVTIIAVGCVMLLIETVLGYEIYFPFMQLVLLFVIISLLFYAPIFTFLFILLRYLHLLSEEALQDKRLIFITILISSFPYVVFENCLPILNDDTVIGLILPYGFAFVTTILLDKFSVLDKLKKVLKKRKNKVSRKHEI